MNTNIAWLDLETTGLDENQHVILQAALVITDLKLQTIDRLAFEIFQLEESLSKMNDYVREMHTKTGLLNKVRKSNFLLSAVEDQLVNLVKKHCPEQATLCGNTIAMDRRFINKYMPNLAACFHYRMLDVSTLKIISQLWFGREYEKPEKGAHTATVDIYNSIKELEHYFKDIIKSPEVQ